MTNSRLSDSQFDALWAVWLGSYGSNSNRRTLESLRRRGLIHGMREQGDWHWYATPEGDAVIASDERSQP